jgi:hypothetical protein
MGGRESVIATFLAPLFGTDRGGIQYVEHAARHLELEGIVSKKKEDRRLRRPNTPVFQIRGWRRRCSLTAAPPFQPSCQSR